MQFNESTAVSEEHVIFRVEEYEIQEISTAENLSCYLLHAGFLLCLLCNPEDVSDISLPYIG
jgi:hypothetical protein